MCQNNIYNRDEGINTSIMFFVVAFGVPNRTCPGRQTGYKFFTGLTVRITHMGSVVGLQVKSPCSTESVFRNVSGSCLRFMDKRASFDLWLSLSDLWCYSHALSSFVYSNRINTWLRKRSFYNLVMTAWRRSRVSREELCCGMRQDEWVICDWSLWIPLSYWHFPLLINMELLRLPPDVCVTTVKHSEPHDAAHLCCSHLKYWNVAIWDSCEKKYTWASYIWVWTECNVFKHLIRLQFNESVS